jgi:hypothetical protein
LDLIGVFSCLKSVGNPDNTDELSFSQLNRYTCLVNDPLMSQIIPIKSGFCDLIGVFARGFVQNIPTKMRNGVLIGISSKRTLFLIIRQELHHAVVTDLEFV